MGDIKKIIDGSVSYLKYKEKYSPVTLYGNEVSIDKSEVHTPEETTSEMPPKKSASKEEINNPIVRDDNSSYSLIREDWMEADTLDELNEKICGCQKCDLWKTRTNFVFGTGNPNADLVVVGEAPGQEEDKQGKPFVGRAGQLLTKILEAINFSREDVYICNILKSRPPNNRIPLPFEIQ